MIALSVEPFEDGWRVTSSETGFSSLAFRSGGEAERTARALGRRYAADGREARIIIRLRNGDTAGSFVVRAGAPDLAHAG